MFDFWLCIDSEYASGLLSLQKVIHSVTLKKKENIQFKWFSLRKRKH